MLQTIHKKILNHLSAVLLVVIIGVFIHLTTSKGSGLHELIAALIIVVIISSFAIISLKKNWESFQKVMVVLAGPMAGFWLFNIFRYNGYVQWPLGSASEIFDYIALLYYHFILSFTVLVPLFIVSAKHKRLLNLGNWNVRVFSKNIKIFLLLFSGACSIWALYVLVKTEPVIQGQLLWVILICLIKACITGISEEVCHRGIIQPAAVAHYGIAAGIVFQACMYTVFHIHLGHFGYAFFSGIGFLAGVMALGIIFGIITHVTSGIGWACIIHTAINVVIEWRNIS